MFEQSFKNIDNLLRKDKGLSTEIDYVAFRGSRNLKNRNAHTTEYIFVLKKTNPTTTQIPLPQS